MATGNRLAGRVALISGGGGEIGGAIRRRRPFGLIAQVVLSFVLLLIAGTVVETLRRLRETGVGVLDASTARLVPDTAIPDYRRFLDVAAELGARHVLASGNDPDEARLTERLQREGGDPNFNPTLRVSTRDLGDVVEVRIRDNGVGITPEIKDKLFQPFFTTKPTGEGTGLGLSISYDIVTQQHGGAIAVDSEEGVFTEFTVRLPRGGRALPAKELS